MSTTVDLGAGTTAAALAYTGERGRLPFELPQRVTVHEVGPRDGFQLEPTLITVDDKVAVVDALSATGLSRIQVTSFVRADAVPQLADGAEVMERITRAPGVEYDVLVPNLKGAERALAVGATTWETMLSTTDAHSRANSNRPTREAFDRLRPVFQLARDHPEVTVVGGMATALACPFEGYPPFERLAEVAGLYAEAGVHHLTVADTAGLADPARVFDVSRRLREEFPDMTVTLHLHNTRGLGIANVLAGLAAGVTDFDTSVGGLGGCPFVPGATGNIATEELVHLLALLGVDTGVDLDRLLEVTRAMVVPLVEHPLESAMVRADPSWHLLSSPDRQQLPAARATTSPDTSGTPHHPEGATR